MYSAVARFPRLAQAPPDRDREVPEWLGRRGFVAGDGIRDDVAHAIKVRFGIPPGAEVGRFARVGLDDLEACLLNGQG